MHEQFQRHLQIGRQFFAASSYARAAQEFEAALALEPDNNYARLFLARCYLNLGRKKELRREVEIALQTDPNDADAHYIAAFASEKPGEIKAALRSIATAIELAPQRADYHEQRAFLLTRQSKYKPALESARRALEIAPNSASAHRQIANTIFAGAELGGITARNPTLSRAKHDEAAFHVARALEIEPDSAYSQMALARLRGFDLEFEDALEKWQEALRLNPTDSYAQHQLRKVQSQVQMERFARRFWGWIYRPLPWPLRLPLTWGLMGFSFYWGVVVPRGHGFFSGEFLFFALVFIPGAAMTRLLLRDWLRFVPDRFLDAHLRAMKKPPLR